MATATAVPKRLLPATRAPWMPMSTSACSTAGETAASPPTMMMLAMSEDSRYRSSDPVSTSVWVSRIGMSSSAAHGPTLRVST